MEEAFDNELEQDNAIDLLGNGLIINSSIIIANGKDIVNDNVNNKPG